MFGFFLLQQDSNFLQVPTSVSLSPPVRSFFPVVFQGWESPRDRQMHHSFAVFTPYLLTFTFSLPLFVAHKMNIAYALLAVVLFCGVTQALDYTACNGGKCFPGSVSKTCADASSVHTIDCVLFRPYQPTAYLTIAFQPGFVGFLVDNPSYDCGRMVSDNWNCTQSVASQTIGNIATGVCNAAVDQSFDPLRPVLGLACNL